MLSGGLDICCEHQEAIFTTVSSSTWLLDNTGVEADPQFRSSEAHSSEAPVTPLGDKVGDMEALAAGWQEDGLGQVGSKRSEKLPQSDRRG